MEYESHVHKYGDYAYFDRERNIGYDVNIPNINIKV